MGSAGKASRTFRSSIAAQVSDGVELYLYKPKYLDVADALRAHLKRHRQALHLMHRVPLRVYTILTPARRQFSATELAMPALLGSAIDCAVWAVQRSPARDGFSWRYPLYGLEMALLSRVGPNRRFDSSVALAIVAPLAETVINRGLGTVLAGTAVAGAPVLADHRRRGTMIPLKSLRFLAVAVAAGLGVRVLARQRARLAELKIATQISAAEATGKCGAASMITTNGGDASLRDFLTEGVLNRFAELGRYDLVEEGRHLVRLRERLEEGISVAADGEAPMYYELSTVLSGWARYSAEGHVFDSTAGVGGTWVRPTWEPMLSGSEGRAGEPEFRYQLAFHSGFDGLRVLTASQRCQLLETLESVTMFDPSEPIHVQDLTPDAPTGGAVEIAINDVEIALSPDGSAEIATGPYDPSALVFLLELPWGFEEWRGGYGTRGLLTSSLGSCVAFILCRTRRLSPAWQLLAALGIQCAGSLPVSERPCPLKSDGTRGVNAVAKAKLPCLILAGYWRELSRWQRLAALCATTSVAVAAIVRSRRTFRWWDALFEGAWVLQAVLPALGASSAFDDFDARLAETLRKTREHARLTSELEETGAWSLRTRELYQEVGQVVQSDKEWDDSARTRAEADLRVAGLHLDRLDARVETLRMHAEASLAPRVSRRTAWYLPEDFAAAVDLAGGLSNTLVIDLENTIVDYRSDEHDRRSAMERALDTVAGDGRIRRVAFLSNGPFRLIAPSHPSIDVIAIGAARKPYLFIPPLRGYRKALAGAAVYGDQPITDGVLAHALRGTWLQPAASHRSTSAEPFWPRVMRGAASGFIVNRWFERMDLGQ